MNFLKKNYKIIIFSIIILLTLVGFFFIMFHKNETKCEFITVKNDYYLVNSDKENNLNVPLFISLKESIFVLSVVFILSAFKFTALIPTDSLQEYSMHCVFE